MKEVWKDIAGYEGLYQVSNRGRVKSLARNTTKGGILTELECRNGYVRVQTSRGNTREKFLIHRLVAQAFILNPKNKPQVNHIDGNKKNNNLKNLEWVTAKENTNHGMEIGSIDIKGEKHYQQKLTEKDVLEIRHLLSRGWTQKTIGRAFGVAEGTISKIKLRTVWKHI